MLKDRKCAAEKRNQTCEDVSTRQGGDVDYGKNLHILAHNHALLPLFMALQDRTAMSVTLEEALLLAGVTAAGDASGAGRDSRASRAGGWRAAERNGALQDANVLRAHGCRLMVAEKNVGRPLYSFNALQRQFIPELYQPPVQTIQDVITSALNRES